MRCLVASGRGPWKMEASDPGVPRHSTPSFSASTSNRVQAEAKGWSLRTLPLFNARTSQSRLPQSPKLAIRLYAYGEFQSSC